MKKKKKARKERGTEKDKGSRDTNVDCKEVETRKDQNTTTRVSFEGADRSVL